MYYLDVWNSHGVLQNKKPQAPCRGGYNTSTTKPRLLPNVNRTTFELERNSGDYASFFNMDRGIPQLKFSHNSLNDNFIFEAYITGEMMLSKNFLFSDNIQL